MQLTGTVAASTTPLISTSGTLSAFTTTAGTASGVQTFNVTGSNLTANITVTAPAEFEVANDGTTWGDTTTINQSGGSASGTVSVRIKASATQGSKSGSITLSSTGATNVTVAVTGTVNAANAATISTGGSLTSFSSYFGFASAAQTFTVSGSNLTESIVVVAPTGYQISLDGTSFSTTRSILPSGGSVTATTVYVRVSASASTGAANGSITLASAGVDPSVTVAVTGTVTTPVLSVSLTPTTVAENAGASASTGTVSLPAGLVAPAGGLAITLVSSDTTEATVPSSVTIAEGASSATFAVAAVTDSTFELLNQTSTITASRTNFTSGTAVLTVTNVDAAPNLTIEIAVKNSPYSQDFNGLGSTTISSAFSRNAGVQTSIGLLSGVTGMNGWYGVQLSGSTTNSDSSLTAVGTTLSSTAGGSLYNFGTVPNERALGSLASGGRIMAFGALIKNTSAETINNLAFSLTGEYWRTSTSQQNRLAFAFGKLGGAVTETNFLSSSSASNESTLDIVGPAVVATNTANLDGNQAANRTLLTNMGLSGLNLLPDETMFIRWSDDNDTGDDAALAIDDLTITALDPALAKPVFGLAGGMYFEGKTLKFSNFSSYAAGVEIRYTTDGSNPTASSSLYNDTTGIALTSGAGSVTVKAIAIDPAPDPDSTSFVASSSYNLPTVIEVSNLTALRAGTNNTSAYYRVTGPVTYTGGHTSRNTKFFQDSGAGIQIDDSAEVVTTSYSAGDNVSGLFGQLSVFSSGQLQFTPAQDFGAPTSTGNIVTPLNRTLATLTDADQAMLVTITGVEFQAANGTATFGAQFTNLNIKDPSLAGFTGWFRNIFGTPLANAVIPSGPVTVTGIVQRTSISSVSYLTVGSRNSAEAGLPPSLEISWSVDLPITEGDIYFDPLSQYLNLRRVGNSTGEVAVQISCSPTGRFALQDVGPLPATVTLPAGVDTMAVRILPVNDTVYSGPSTLVTITAAAAGHTSGTTTATIFEDDPVPTAPSGFSYTPSTVSGTVGTAISSLTPTVTGTVDTYSVSPSLPAGLSINSTSGVISGTPSAVAASATYTVAAANAGGSTTTTITVAVVAADPLADYMTSFGLSGPDAAGDADPDKDGQDNNAELAFGTDPTNGASRAATLATGTGTIKLVYLQRNSGVAYTVKSFTDLSTSFDSGGTVVTPTATSPQPGGVRVGYTQYEASLSTGSGKGFLRVKAVR